MQKSEVINPSNGLFGVNPTHQEIAKESADQSEIVKAITNSGSGVSRMRVTYNYKDLDATDPLPLSGILKIREMSVEQAQRFCKTLMRSRPNIFKVEIKLGDYPSARRIDNFKTRTLDSDKPRFHTELGEKIGDILADKSMFVTHLVYTVNNAEVGNFSATAEVYGTNTEEYEKDELFNPVISFEFIKHT
jgi:hypothetical protein